MYSRDRQGKGSKGLVQFKTTKGRLQIVFSYPIEEDGEIKRKRFGSAKEVMMHCNDG